MDSPDTPISENELNAFLSGADPLAQQLQQLAQEPSAALTAAIMQRVALQQTQTLNQNSHLKTQQPSSVAEQIQRQPAANDAGNLNLVPQTKLTQWLRRWQAVLTLPRAKSPQGWETEHMPCDEAGRTCSSFLEQSAQWGEQTEPKTVSTCAPPVTWAKPRGKLEANKSWLDIHPASNVHWSTI